MGHGLISTVYTLHIKWILKSSWKAHVLEWFRGALHVRSLTARRARCQEYYLGIF